MRSHSLQLLARFAAVGALLALLGSTGCATYSDRMQSARDAAAGGDYASSMQQVVKLMKLDDPGQLPEEFSSDTALAVLERGTLNQALGNYAPSARDFQAADKELEILDIANDTAGDIGKYVFSDSATKYKAPPVEKLALNGFNMMNYLAQRDLAGSRVEARRFTVMQSYLSEISPEEVHAAFGSYLAGFTMEQLGEYTSAMRYYDEALAARDFESLAGPVARLAELTAYRGKRITAYLEKHGSKQQARKGDGDLLVVVSIGRAPHKVPERMPIGAAIGLAGTYISGNPEVLGYTATKVVVYPELAPVSSVYRKAELALDEAPAALELATDLGAEIKADYERAKPKIIGAAISRMIVRAAAAEGARAAAKSASDDNALAGFLAAIFTEAALVAFDKPDTRSWNFLPERVLVYRTRVAAGQHAVTIVLSGGDRETYQREIEVPAGGFAAIILTAPR